MDKLQEKKSNAKAAYIKARNEWENIRTIEDIKGDFEKWKAFCERKRDCIFLGVRIQASGGVYRGSISRLAIPGTTGKFGE